MVKQNSASGANKDAMTKEQLDKLLRYDGAEGHFIRLVGNGRWKAGEIAGTVHKHHGYIQIKVDGRQYYAHRLAHLAMTGEFPRHMMDHINGYRADNRWTNLRPSTASQNQLNKAGYGASGVKNIVIYDTKAFGIRYRVVIKRDGNLFSEVFSDLDNAIACRDEFLRKHAGEFANTAHRNDM